MATFDQLPADQRAIIELLLKRGRSYDALSDMLDMPASRVRELAREALTELAPRSADRVDPDWKAQVADYALGQQSGPEETATQGHLKRSEPARAWLLSLMDSLDQLYTAGTRPELPSADGERPRARERKERARERKERGGGASAAVSAASDRTRGRDEDEDEDDKPKKDTKRLSALSGRREGGALSPAARAHIMRRRLIAGAVGLVLLVLLVLQLTGNLFGGGDDGGDTKASNENRGSDTQPAGQQQTKLIGQLQLEPVGKQPKDTIGIAAIAKTGNKTQMAIQAKLPKVGAKEAYEVWLYNDDKDAVSIGAQKPDAEGNYQGAGEIPADYAKYKFIDVSLEKIDQDRKHSGNSILRGEIANLQAPQQGQQGGQQAPGGQQPQP